jgi:hypothetical protein
VLALACACTDDNDDAYATYPVSVQLVYPGDSDFTAEAGVKVRLANTITGTLFDTVTNATGRADFNVPAGIYEASASDSRSAGGFGYIFNGLKSNLTVNKTWDDTTPAIELTLTLSKAGQVLIKELYVGGCPKDDGSGTFQMDKYVILYNNSDFPAALDSLAFGIVYPYNAVGDDYHDVNGNLTYATEGWMPAGSGVWYFTSSVTLEPWQQIVIAITGAIDQTGTYSNSINFNNPAYYTMYDPESGFSNATYYPSPVVTIPTSHYLKALKFAAGNAWVISAVSPAFFIFSSGDVPLQTFVTAEQYIDPAGTTSLVRKKLPVEWVVDGIEVFRFGAAENYKRILPVVDAGSVMLENGKGYTLYRNVDKAATEAIEGNAAKLVYGYSLGTADVEGTTDPSGIDAEASIRNGARIVYKDTNNSSNDFHQRSRASLRN